MSPACAGLPAPGRRELLEGIQTALGQGEPLGRGRALARAMEAVLVGDRRGALPPGAPRSGLLVEVEQLLAELRLPGPESPPEPVELRLDPERSPLDRRRHLTLRRLCTAGVRYGEDREVAGLGGAQALGRRWSVRWQPATAATLELAALAGSTLRQAAGRPHWRPRRNWRHARPSRWWRKRPSAALPPSPAN